MITEQKEQMLDKMWVGTDSDRRNKRKTIRKNACFERRNVGQSSGVCPSEC